MIQDKIHLTIGLALSNDDHEARRSFFSALPACFEFNDIELLICDNSPKYNRNFIHQNKLDNVRYVANEKDIGAIENFNQIHSKALGSFVLILGDDDIIHPFFCDQWEFIRDEIIKNPQRSIYSLPQHFNSPNNILTTDLPVEFYQHIQSRQLIERAAAISSIKTLNYFFYSIHPRNSISWQIAYYYAANCPGYTRAFDWAISYGNLLVNPGLQLNTCYYIYNNKNWCSPEEFVEREVNLFKPDLKEELHEILNTNQIQTIRLAANAAICCSYFLCLGSQQERLCQDGFNPAEFYNAASLIINKRFLSLIPLTQGSWEQICHGSQESLRATLNYILNQIKENYRKELIDDLGRFLGETPKTFSVRTNYVL